jgi:DNA mismatch endonuclease (patch repair protein)
MSERKRSEVMSRIRGKGNKDTEIALARLLRANGITGWRRQANVRVEGGKRKGETTEILRQAQDDRRRKRRSRRDRPTTVRVDFTFPKQRVVVFVDGCFWHGCPKHSSPAKWLKKSSMPSSCSSRLRGEKKSPRSGRTFWRSKMLTNIARDRFVTRSLRRQGWRVVRIWEHDLTKSPARCLRRIRKATMPSSGRYQSHPHDSV